MAIEVRRGGDLFRSGAHVLVNPVNCVGVMGAGLAAEFKTRFPGMFEDYAEACKTGVLRVGTIHEWSNSNPRILNVPTKDHWKQDSRLEIVDASLAALRGWLEDHRRPLTIAMPALGCGLGGLNWSQVLALIEERLGDLRHRIIIYEPQ